MLWFELTVLMKRRSGIKESKTKKHQGTDTEKGWLLADTEFVKRTKRGVELKEKGGGLVRTNSTHEEMELIERIKDQGTSGNRH